MTETLSFDAEVDKIFRLMIHSIYENKDIFLRELISNASDACDKLRYKALTNQELLGNDTELNITISIDEKAKTLTICDNGIGMSKQEMIQNLGTIARSGTENFLDKLSGDKKKDAQLIGQFGVGFYSSFMVANKVEVTSLAAGKKKAHKWVSEGKKNFTIEALSGDHPRGTSVTLHLNDEAKEYLDTFRVEHIIKTYSNHVAFDIFFTKEEGKDPEKINDGKALWTRSKSDISDDEYNEFYQSVSQLGQDEPWMTLHNKAEGTIEYTNLLFIPSQKPFNLFHPDRDTQVKLFIKRVFIAEDGIDIIPPYLRFVRGVVDSEDLPLNISRETVQNSVTLQKIRKSITKRIFKELTKKAEKDPESYATFWENFGPVIKEGLCDGMEPRDDIIEACRFRTNQSNGELISLKTYLERMKDGQKSIYYLIADNRESALASPQLEGFVKTGHEVILLTDSVDDFWVSVLHEYQGIDFKSVTRASTDLDDSNADNNDEENDSKAANENTLSETIIAFFKATLGENVSDVRSTNRLTDSPVCLTAPDSGMDIRMERFLVENKQLAQVSAKILEVNPEHPIITQLETALLAKETEEKARDLVHLLFAQANIVEGEPVKDIGGFAKRMNHLLEKALAA